MVNYDEGKRTEQNLIVRSRKSEADVWYSWVLLPTRHIIWYFGDDFTGQTTQPTVSQY